MILGGYNFANTARLWASIVGLLTNTQLKNDIPEHDNFLIYGPEYELATSSGMIRNKNTIDYVNKLSDFVLNNLNYVRL